MSDGPPVPDASAQPLDDWSRAVAEQLATWPLAERGAWSRHGPGLMMLRLDHDGAGSIDPVRLHTEDQELTVTLGLWEQAFPEEEGGRADPVEAARQARALVEDWLSGRLMIADFFDADGKWCGSLTAGPDDVDARLAYAVEALADYSPRRCQLRRPRRAEWRMFDIRDGRLEPVPSEA